MNLILKILVAVGVAAPRHSSRPSHDTGHAPLPWLSAIMAWGRALVTPSISLEVGFRRKTKKHKTLGTMKTGLSLPASGDVLTLALKWDYCDNYY